MSIEAIDPNQMLRISNYLDAIIGVIRAASENVKTNGKSDEEIARQIEEKIVRYCA